MLEKLRPEDEKIVACLRDNYSLTVTDIELLALGYDSRAAVFRIRADGQRYFLKVKSDAVNELSVSLPRYLKENGIAEVVAPLPTTTHELWGKLDDFAMLLYPFIEGQTGMQAGLSDSQWVEFGAILKKLHTTQLPPGLLNRMPKEAFVPNLRWSAIVKQLQAEIPNRAYDNPIEQQLATFWKEKREEIARILDRTEQLGHVLQRKSLDFVVCHADIHTANLLIDPHGKLFIVDWDQPILAPIECDLLFVTVGAFVKDEKQEALFFEGYGKTDVDPLAMAYYRYARVVEDMGAFAESAFFMDVNDETKLDSLKWIRWMFEPGNILESAHKWDQVLDI